MSGRGYKEMRQQFFMKTGLSHSTKQLKNRMTQCKALYSFWVMLNNHTALGRRPDGTIIAPLAFWKKETDVISIGSLSLHIRSCGYVLMTADLFLTCFVSFFVCFRKNQNVRSSCMAYLLMLTN